MIRFAASPLVVVLSFALSSCGGGGGGSYGGSASGGALDPATISNRSTNWSGYIHTAPTGEVTRVSAVWVVPGVQCGADNTSSSSWTGIGGQSIADPLLIQAGTGGDCSHGAPIYYVWWEGFPAPAVTLDASAYDVQPGDTVSVALDGSSRAVWTINIHNSRAGWTFNQTIPFGNAGVSGEWIQEAPLVAGGGGAGQSDLANFGRISFFGLGLNGSGAGLRASDAIVMTNASGSQVIAAPSAPTADGSAFSVCFGSGACS